LAIIKPMKSFTFSKFQYPAKVAGKTIHIPL